MCGLYTLLQSAKLWRATDDDGACCAIATDCLLASVPISTSLAWRMARPEGFEPPTPKFVAWCSIQLSYGRLVCVPDDTRAAILAALVQQVKRYLPAPRRQASSSSFYAAQLAFAADALKDFLAMHGHFARRLDADAYLIALDAEHGDFNVVADHYGLADSPCQNKHPCLPLDPLCVQCPQEE
jgi:hypothetical protein